MSLVGSQLALTFDKAQDVLDVWLWRVRSLQLAKAYKECLKLRNIQSGIELGLAVL